jgi:hypothetical protein
MDRYYSSIRIKIPVETYYKNKENAIKSILGSDIEIKSINKVDLIIGNNIILDINYSKLDFDANKLYFIKTSDLKSLSINSSKKIALVDNTPVVLTVPSKYKDYKIIPININKCLKRESEQNTQFEYYGKINTNPLHFCSSLISYPEIQILNGTELNETVINKDIETNFEEEQIKIEYENIIKQSPYSNVISKIEKYKQGTKLNQDTAYIMNFKVLSDFNYGVVYVLKIRKLFDVLYIPITYEILNSDILKNIENILVYDYIEYCNVIDNLEK